MFRSGWTVVGLGLLFVIIQSCGDDFGTGRIMTPGATPEVEQGEEQQVAPQEPEEPAPVAEPMKTDDGWPDYQYDDGRELWDGAEAIDLGEWHWNQGVAQYRGQNGRRFTMKCIAMGSDFAVWGANPYTDDSPVCAAAAHLGLITRAHGGRVTVEIRPAQRRFEGVTRNGVTGFAWGPYPGSYVVLK